ncbi:FadR/GntR family transcriptional regulator [Rathayibacter sp. Leaf296]|uniref:FadR/GntR family transcriptional regulator n=1 Tax=Rathayibacter sp. Leaf296 TaxID=1736327 RepID=UPI000B1B731F|nr:FCD domain-containing protein [Rathayibacter sp. Leaf296]
MSSTSEGVGNRRYLALAQRLLAAINRGDYRPGERLPAHTEIAAEAGVSRATAREAFLALELIGAIDVRHGDGTFVSLPAASVGGAHGSPLDSPPRELIETRLHLEPIAAGLAAHRIDDDRLALLTRNVDEQAELVAERDQVARFVSLGLQFHTDLAPACGNRLFGDIIDQLVSVGRHPLWELVNQRGLPTVESREEQVRQHRAVLDAIRARDADRARAAMHQHLDELNTSIFDPSHQRPGTSA